MTGSNTVPVEGEAPLETDFLIAGLGPAGASLAAFLSRYGLTGLAISAAGGTAKEPRAHITNQGALDAFRDLGLIAHCERLGNRGRSIQNYRWSDSMAGEEYGRLYSWGHDPARRGEYEAASPNFHIDLPQTHVEPMLVKFATDRGFKARFDTELLRFEERRDGKIVCFLKDKITGAQYSVLTTYLFGADGGKSVVAKGLGLEFDSKPGGGMGYNLLVKAEMAHLMTSRPGNLHWTYRWDNPVPYLVVWRMVEPWHSWMVVVLPSPGVDMSEPTMEQFEEIVRDTLGDDSVKFEITDISRWQVNEIVAKTYARGNIFCLGDACHRHPPTNGLGSNTCIQDAFNLAWKVRLVHSGAASASLLATYDRERQPVGAEVVEVANISLRRHAGVWEALGLFSRTAAERKVARDELAAGTPAGRDRRRRLRDAILSLKHETLALGVEMGQRYDSAAVFAADERAPFEPTGKEAEDAVMHYEPCTYPGRRLPHVWLNKTVMERESVSTIDIAGKGAFCLITGSGGDAWKEAAVIVAKDLRLDINAVSIGYRQDWEDIYQDWSLLRGVEEDGAVLVRPDLFVAWRTQTLVGTKDECAAKLKAVLKSILGF